MSSYHNYNTHFPRHSCICITKVHFYYDIYTKLYYLLTSKSKRIVRVARYSPDEKRTKMLSFTEYSGKDIASRHTTIVESTL